MDESSEHPPRSRSNTTTSLREKVRPKSRGSTTSLQSIGVGNAFQPTPPLQQGPIPGNQQHGPIPGNQHHAYSAQPPPQAQQQPMYNYQQDLAMLQHQSVMQPIQSHQVMATHARAMSQHDILPVSAHAYPPVQPYPGQFQPPVAHWNMQPPAHLHIRHASEQYEGSPAPEDSNSEARRKKGGSSTLANDQELRRLLSQNQHRLLPEVASDVQKSEGSGGKSEKAKQIFAMLWLRENCVRSSQSVRRDRVFAKYTEKCGDMRVPTLNPASFGKLVRIIFPNVQTRRLGVRGESKYHYVDLSLVGGDDERQYTSSFDRPSTAAGLLAREPSGSVKESQQSAVQMARTSSQVETADFPQPQLPAYAHQHDHDAQANGLKLDCKYSNTATIRLPVRDVTPGLLNALPAVRQGMPGTLSTYVAMPNLKSLTSPAPSAPDKPFDLPDILPYLEGQTYDPHMAKALSNLYRSYCIDVIDAFRKCKEKPFFSHHTAFNGKMTVPVAKLFNLECLAPWLHECDMRMYKQIISFLAPLAIQTVPDMVWMFFERVSTRLVPHIISTFEEKCPVHVVVAKGVPAARFTNLLKKLKDANIATLQLNKMLNDPQQRTQMWLDLMVMVEPDRLLDDSVPPAESFTMIQGILKHDLRTLIEPREGALVAAAEDDLGSSYAQFLGGFSSSSAPPTTSSGVLNLDEFGSQPSLLEKWIGWLESLPDAFIGHHPQCMMDWHTKFWRSLMMQVGSGGAHSYQSWWYVETFAQQMLAWMCEMQGMLMSEQDQKREDAKELEKKTEAHDEPTLPEMPEHHHHVAHATADEDTDAEMDEITRGGPLDLPSIHTGLTSPVKLQSAPGNIHTAVMQASVAKHLMQHHHHTVASASLGDDSGIGLDIDDQDHDENLKEARKFNRRDWLLSSDPVDGQAGVGLGLTA
ncbi:hypothetical protein DV737_g217, partial [Chaetothyriales sp. CBS 132003]